MSRRFLVLLILLGQAMACYSETVLSTDTLISDTDLTYDGSDLVVSGATVTVSGRHSFKSLSLVEGAVVTHPPASEPGELPLQLVVVGTLSIDGGSSVNLTGRGYFRGLSVSNSATLGSKRRCGGSHGGMGGSLTGDAGPTYGNLLEPVFPGAGGGPEYAGGNGGGCVVINAGEVVLHGFISADGADGGYRAGGGAGGSVLIRTGTFTGAGCIRANGGRTGTGGTSGGGGGRIAIYCSDGQFPRDTCSVQAFGGAATYGGGAGSICIQDSTGVPEVVFCNGTLSSALPTPLDMAWPFPGNITISGSGTRVSGNSGFVVCSNLSIMAGARLTHDLPSQSPVDGLSVFSSGEVRVDSGAAIDVRALGYGPGKTLGNVSVGASTGRSGGSYGGLGGYCGGTAGLIYGSAGSPAAFGSGAGDANGGNGGGFVRITAPSVHVDGAVDASGSDGLTDYGGAGSGGSIYVETLRLSGAGSMNVSGGNGGRRSGGGGGGGRVAVHAVDSIGYQGSVTASAGTGVGTAQPGTELWSAVQRPLTFDVSPRAAVTDEVSQISLLFCTMPIPVSAGSAVATLMDPDGHAIESELRPFDPVTWHVLPAVPLSAEGTYTVSISGVCSLTGGLPPAGALGQFCIDRTPPNPPTIANVDLCPATNVVMSDELQLAGTRDDGSEIWINGVRGVSAGVGPWSLSISLEEGVNEWSVWAQDEAGNRSASLCVSIAADSVAPQVLGFVPSDGSVTNSAPACIEVLFVEETSGLNTVETQLVVTRNGWPVPGDLTELSIAGSQSLRFEPSGGFLDGVYEISATLVDRVGHASQEVASTFTIDTIIPDGPHVNPVVSPTAIDHQLVSGGKELGADLFLGGSIVVDATAQTQWAVDVVLVGGANELLFWQVDQAGNTSPAVNVAIVFDDAMPGPVHGLSVDGNGDGHSIRIGWPGYSEEVNGSDINRYDVYRCAEPFTNTAASGVSVVASVPAGSCECTVAGLTTDVTSYYAVVAIDVGGLSDPAVLSVAACPVDVHAPPDPQHLAVEVSHQASVSVAWDVPDEDPDLLGFRVYCDGRFIAELPPSARRSTIDGLEPASACTVRVAAIDSSRNESGGSSVIAYTLLANPSPLVLVPMHGAVKMTWPPAQPAAHVDHYNVYVANAPFGVASASALHASTTENAIMVSGLMNGQTNYFAVTSVNRSGGEVVDVVARACAAEADAVGPRLETLHWEGGPFPAVVPGPGTISVQFSDAEGILSSHISVGGVVCAASGGPAVSLFWRPLDEKDGVHTLTLFSLDAHGNETRVHTNVLLRLEPPASPVLTSPHGVAPVATEVVDVSGHANSAASTIVLMVNSAEMPTEVPVSADGSFASIAVLSPGTNTLEAVAVNRAGRSAPSEPVLVVMDASSPGPPQGLSANAAEAGTIRLAWSRPVSGRIEGYVVYRSSSAFEDRRQAVRLNPALHAGDSYVDVLAEDGPYFYGVAAVSAAGVEGDLSQIVTSISDATLPVAFSIGYTTEGTVVDGCFGTGTVHVTVVVSEELVTPPFLSMTKSGAGPIAVLLRNQNDGVYTGKFDIVRSLGDGTLYAALAMRDRVGNRGDLIESGSEIRIDVTGPVAPVLRTFPPSPVLNVSSSPATVTVLAEFDPQDIPIEPPTLLFRLLESQPEPCRIELTPQSGSSWVGSVVLPDVAGVVPETLEFSCVAFDALANRSDYSDLSPVQVYQGPLPPLDPPSNVCAAAWPRGGVALRWDGVDGCSGYAVFRQAPGEGDLLEYVLVGSVTEWIGTAPDGTNWFAVATLREANGVACRSALSERVQVVSDSVPPLPPTDLLLRLRGEGLHMEWHPSDGDGLFFSVYRSRDAITPTSVGNLTPLLSVQASSCLDTNPVQQRMFYAVTARDAAGNESGPSSCVSTNVGLLPPHAFSVTRNGDQPPVLEWEHRDPDAIGGYRLCAGEDPEETSPLHSGVLPANMAAYSDGTYGGGKRYYSIEALDSVGGEEQASLPRVVLLPDLSVSMADGESISRGAFGALSYDVVNRGSVSLSNVVILAELADRLHASAPFCISGGQTNAVGVVVGGYASLAEEGDVTTTIRVPQAVGVGAVLRQTDIIPVSSGAPTLEIWNGPLLRGGEGSVSIGIHNNAAEPVQILTATETGRAPSPDVRFTLTDSDGFVFSSASLLQSSGMDITTLANGVSVAEIAPGGDFRSAPVAIPVPASVTDDLVLHVYIDQLHWRYGRPEHISVEGGHAKRHVSAAETPYIALATNASPRNSQGQVAIVISGDATYRESSLPASGVPVQVTVSVAGFDRRYSAMTDLDGHWTLLFNPEPNEAGVYAAWASYPGGLDRSAQCSFSIDRVLLSPSSASVTIPRNYEQHIDVEATFFGLLSVTNLRFECVAADQPSGTLPAGLHVTPGNAWSSVDVPPAKLSLNVWGDNTASRDGIVWLSVVSDGAAKPWARFAVAYTLTDPVPVPWWDPVSLETGVMLSNSVTETILLENRGAIDWEHVQVSLSAAPGGSSDWVLLSGGGSIGDILPGGEKPVRLQFAPRSQDLLGQHRFELVVTSGNCDVCRVPIHVTVDNSGKGSAIFHVTDPYLGLAGDGGVNAGVKGATVTLRKAAPGIVPEAADLRTDDVGEVWFSDMSAGSYDYQIDSDGHRAVTGVIAIKPGATVSRDVFLPLELVTVDWSVVPTDMVDRYAVEMTATFEVDVPVPVVVAEPMSVTVPEMDAGDVFNGEFRLKNYGLVRAAGLRFAGAVEDPYFRFELLCEPLGFIDAGEDVPVAYRLTCLSPLSGPGAGGFNVYSKPVTFTYEVTCANGGQYDESARFYCMGSTDSRTRPIVWSYVETDLLEYNPDGFGGFGMEPPSTVLPGGEDGDGCPPPEIGLKIENAALCVDCTVPVTVTMDGCAAEGCPESAVVRFLCSDTATVAPATVMVHYGEPATVYLTGVKGSREIDADTLLAYSGIASASARYTVVELADLVVEPNVGIGDSTQPEVTVMPPDWPVTWSIADRCGDGDEVVVSVSSADGTLCVDEDSGSGWVMLRVEPQGMACTNACYLEEKVSIDCGGCASCGKTFGNGGASLGSARAAFFLGVGKKGDSLGRLYLYGDELSSALGNASSLKCSSSSSQVVVREDGNGTIRQVATPAGFVDVLQRDLGSFDMRWFVGWEDVSTNRDGLYVAASAPDTIWRIQSATDDETGGSSLDVVRIVSGQSVTNSFAYSALSNSWSFSEGNGLRVERRTTLVDTGEEKTVVTETSNAAGEVAARVSETQVSFPWGDEVTESIVHCAGEDLVTTYTYCGDPSYVGTYGRLTGVVSPDGSWSRLEYDLAGRLVSEASPWRDSPLGSSTNAVRLTLLDYDSVDTRDTLTRSPGVARTTLERICGVDVSKTFRAFVEGDDGARTEITERCLRPDAAYGNPANIRTTTRYNATNDTDSAECGEILDVTYADGRVDTYSYSYGTVTVSDVPEECNFTPGEGNAWSRTVTHGVLSSPDGIPFETTRQTTVVDENGNSVLSDTYVYTGSGFDRLSRTVTLYDELGQASRTIRSDGAETESVWGCCGKERSTGADGSVYSWEYDALRRVVASVKHGVTSVEHGDQHDVIEERSYDAAGRQLSTTIRGGDLQQTSSQSYDMAGRVVESVDAAGLVTVYSYANGGSRATTTLPGGLASVTDSCLSGQARSVVVGGVTNSYRDYGIYPDGSRWTCAWQGPDGTNSVMWERAVTDALGRTVREERPGFGGVVLTNAFFYDSVGRLVCQTTPGMANRLIEYDEAGNESRSGLDVDGNGRLSLDSLDRIAQSRTRYARQSVDLGNGTTLADGWWRVSDVAVCLSEDATLTTTRVAMVRLSGFEAGVTAEEVSFDSLGNATVTRTTVDREHAVTIHTTDIPQSVRDATSVSINGRVAVAEDVVGRQTVFRYDELGRRTGVRDPRKGWETVEYDDAGRVAAQWDAAGNARRFEYDSVTGHQVRTIAADGGVTHVAYDSEGRVAASWGNRYPVRYEYDVFGRMAALYTVRGDDSSITNLSSFLALTSHVDRTSWQYDPVTGALTNKVYADGRGVQFRYTPDGRLIERQWARGVTTSYAYDEATGNQTAITYSDGTPPVQFEYDRAGRLLAVSDAAGERVFAYDALGRPTDETLNAGMFRYAVRRAYDELGRGAGLVVEGATPGVQNLALGYTYDEHGRLGGISVAGQVAGQGQAWSYGYVTNSHLLASASELLSGTSSRRTYEASRDLLLSHDSWHKSDLVSRYAYTNDILGRRVGRHEQVGSTGADDVLNVYRYNHRSELAAVQSLSSMGTQSWSYAFDPIGNRLTSSNASGESTCDVNELNQLVRCRSGADATTYFYDADGNLERDDRNAYQWNAENRLVVVSNTVSGLVVSNAYDYLGRRTRKSVTAGHGALLSDTRFVYDGWNLIAEVMAESSGTTTNHYVWGLDLSGTLQGAGGVGGLLAAIGSEGTCFPCQDGSGNIGQYIDDAGEIESAQDYDAFGKTESSHAFPFGFSSKYRDPETSLLYYGYRYYNPTQSRWLNRDPIAENGGLNLYGFVNNNPVNSVDRLGLALYAFDGTANVPTDETNVHLTYGSGWDSPNAHYEKGIGNEEEHSAIDSALRKASGWGLSAKRSTMLDAMKSFLKNGDNMVDVVGFSRGAVTAITFAETIQKLKKKDVYPYCMIEKVRFLGLYDPVPGPFIGHRPRIPGIVQKTAIAYSIDEKRDQFEQSNYSGPNITRMAFRGGHSDVGGGYEQRGLANISLEWMIDQGRAAQAPFKNPTTSKSPGMIRHQEINYNLFLYTDRRGLGGIPRHPSVSRLVAGPVDEIVRSPRFNVDVTSYTYYLDSVAPGNDKYRVGDGRF